MNNEDQQQYYEAVESPFRESYQNEQQNDYDRYEE